MTRATRLVAQLLLLPLLWVLASLDGSLYQLAVAIAIVVVWPITVAMAVVLVWLARAAERSPALEGPPATLVEAADNAVTMALISSGLALFGVLVVLRQLGLVAALTGRPVLVLLGWALLLVCVPSLSWARTLRRVWLPMITRRR